ncbi:MAG TPA: hypothetical protein VGQ57_20760, partial [Polyangiaceae bacterium]|nr:hypothetical protein [Polyangiaceae bacterium]
MNARRAFLLGLAASACTRRKDLPSAPPAVPPPPPSASAAPGRVPADERTWKFPESGVGRMNVVVVVPEHAEGQRFPVLIALHGRGETLKGPERGARGWVDDYALGRATERLAHPPLAPADFENFVEPERMKALNAALAAE